MAESRDTKKNHSLRNFKGVNTQADRKVIDDDEFAWLENVIPIGNGNAKTVYGPSAALYALPGGKTCYYMDEGNINGVSYMFMFCTDGSAYQVNLLTFAQTVVGAAGTFSGTHTRFAQWKNERIVLIDVSNGYFDWDGATLTAYKGTVASVNVVNGGLGYTAAPNVTGSGSATFTAYIGVDLAGVVTAGTGYWVGDVLTMDAAAWFPITGFILPQITVSSVDASGAITGANISTIGYGQTGLAFHVHFIGGHGSGATFNLNERIVSVSVNNPGSGYTSAPALNVGYFGLSFFTGTISGATLNVTIATLGTPIAIGQTIIEAGVGNLGTIIAYGTGTGGTGTYQLSASYTRPTPFTMIATGTGGSVTANLSISASGTSIGTYAGRVWIASGRSIIFSAPNSYSNFDPTQLAGSLVMSDETMKGSIVRLFSANDFLYIIGQNSVNVISNVTVTQPVYSTTGALLISSTTIFSNTNITPSIGTTMGDSVVSYYRSIMFATDYGVMSLTGSTPQKISDPLDGMYQNIDFTQPISGGVVVIFNILCLCYLVKYNDPVAGVTRQLLCLFFNKKWYFSSQVEGMNFIATAYPVPDVPSVWATNGTSLYKLFSNSTGAVSQIIQSKLWDMTDPLVTKQVLKFGLETISSLPSALTVNIDTDVRTTNYSATGGSVMLWYNNLNQPIVWTNNLSQPITWYSTGYVFARKDVSNVGNYVGITGTATTPGVTYVGFHLQYENRTPWTGTPF